MNEARMITVASDIIYPLLESMIAQRINRMCSEFNGGEHEHIANVAYIAALKEFKAQLQSLQTKGNQARVKLENKN